MTLFVNECDSNHPIENVDRTNINFQVRMSKSMKNKIHSLLWWQYYLYILILNRRLLFAFRIFRILSAYAFILFPTLLLMFLPLHCNVEIMTTLPTISLEWHKNTNHFDLLSNLQNQQAVKLILALQPRDLDLVYFFLPPPTYPPPLLSEEITN